MSSVMYSAGPAVRARLYVSHGHGEGPLIHLGLRIDSDPVVEVFDDGRLNRSDVIALQTRSEQRTGLWAPGEHGKVTKIVPVPWPNLPGVSVAFINEIHRRRHEVGEQW